MATTTTTITNTGGIANSLNTPARADEDDVSVDCGTIGSSNEEEYIQVYRERILVGGSYFPPDNSESGSDRSEWNGMLHDISSLFPATKSETDDSSPEFSRSNSDSIMSIFLPATSPIDSPENYKIIARSRSIPSYSIMSIFPPAMSEIDSPDNYEIIFRNPSIPSYYHFFPPDMSDTDSYGSSTPNHQLSIPSYYHFFPPDMSDTDSYGSSTPNHQLSIPSLYFPPNDSETDNSSSLVNGISLDERVVIYPKIDPEVVIPSLNPGGYVDAEVMMVVGKTWLNKQTLGSIIPTRRKSVKLLLFGDIFQLISALYKGEKKRARDRSKHPVYRGVRMRTWGKWVSKIREPRNGSRGPRRSSVEHQGKLGHP